MSGKQNSFKFAWERAIGKTRYVASVKQVARVLSSYAHLDGSNAHPGIERIMADCSLKRSAVLAAIRILTEDGWIAKAPRSGVKRHYFDHFQLTKPAWLTDPDAERPDERREAERAVVAERMREERRAKAEADQVHMYGPNQIQTYGPDTEINWPDHTDLLGPYTGPDQVHTSGRLGPYTDGEAAGQVMALITSGTTLKNNPGAPGVAGSPRSPHAAEPHVPHGVELADARSSTHITESTESTGPVAVPYKAHRVEAFRNESDVYVAAAKKLDWATVAAILGKWKDACADEYEWARKTALRRMGRGGTLKTARGFERADRLTIESALRMHLNDGCWSKSLLEPLGVPELPLMPLLINDLKNQRRGTMLAACFEALRRMDHKTIVEFGLRFRDEEPDLFGAALAAAKVDAAARPDLTADKQQADRLVCMQIMNTTKDWPEWMTKTLNAVDGA